MSSVDLATALRARAGEFPEDNCTAIWFYNNIFTGGDTYKLVFNNQRFDPLTIVGTNIRLWWKKEVPFPSLLAQESEATK